MASQDDYSSKERMNRVLERGKADRVPVALVSDFDYQAQAAGIDPREFRYGDNEARAEIQRRFWLGHEGNDFLMVEEAKRHGLKVLFWFLGDCIPLLEDIVGLGVDGLVVEQPRRGYSTDPGEVRRIVGKRICVYGWSPELAMIKGDREAISRTIEKQIQDAGLDGAFVMGSMYLTSEVSCETVDFFCDEVARVSRGRNA